MSAFAYHEPHRFSAGVLTLLTHVVFFALLYLGVNWHVESPQGMEVDLWANLPQVAAQPPSAAPAPVPPAPVQKVEPVKQKEAEQPVPPAKAEIELPQKKKVAEKPKEKVAPPAKKLPSKAEQKRAQQELEALNAQAEQADLQAQAEREKQATAQAAEAAKARAAITSEVDKYKGLIGSKIRRYVVVPPDVADDAVAEFVITLLPDGSLVADPKLVKSSGSAAYDSAVERAILRAEPLPLPKDEEARKQFINPTPLKLKFSPRDGQ